MTRSFHCMVSKYLSLWTWQSMELVIFGGICVSQTHLIKFKLWIEMYKINNYGLRIVWFFLPIILNSFEFLFFFINVSIFNNLYKIWGRELVSWTFFTWDTTQPVTVSNHTAIRGGFTLVTCVGGGLTRVICVKPRSISHHEGLRWIRLSVGPDKSPI